MTIAPHLKLLIFTALLLFPFAIISTLLPSTVLPFGLTVFSFLIIVLVDAFLSRQQFNEISIDIADIIRLSKNRKSSLYFRIVNTKNKSGMLRIGLALPEHIKPEPSDIAISLSDYGNAFTLSWPVTSLKQGSVSIHNVYLETSSPMRFWVRRSALPVSSEIRTYPNLLSDRKDIAAVLMNKNIGVHSHRQIGKGRDFEQLREYFPGDNYEDIHWKATAKRGIPITKIYQIERTQRIYIIIDASRLSTRTIKTSDTYMPGRLAPLANDEKRPKEETILERFVNAALILGLAAERQGDLFGLLTFAEKVRGFIKAKTGKAHFNACRDMLFSMEPQVLNPEFSELFTFLGTKIRKRALLLFFTSLDDPVLSQNFIHHIHLLTRQHVVMINMVKPWGAQPLFSSPDIDTIDDIYTALGNHFVWENLKETQRQLQRHGAGFHLLDNEKMCAQVISQYMNIKKRQIL